MLCSDGEGRGSGYTYSFTEVMIIVTWCGAGLPKWRRRDCCHCGRSNDRSWYSGDGGDENGCDVFYW